MRGTDELIEYFIEQCLENKGSETAYKNTVELANIFYTKNELQGFMEFYNKFGRVFANGITTAV